MSAENSMNIKSEKNREIGNKPSSPMEIKEIFKDLAKFNGQINRMDLHELIVKLKEFGLETGGSKDALKKRLKNNYRKIQLNTINFPISKKILPYYVVIDFEATCNEINLPDFQQEIIEFPAVLICTNKLEIVDTFHMYCKPQVNPQLSAFCVQLTGITQGQVDSAESFEIVLGKFEEWLKKHSLGKKHMFAVVTDASSDMSRFLFGQCECSQIPFPKWGRNWVNIKRTYSNFYKRRWLPLKSMLEQVGMEFEGRLHCGLDDAKNISRLFIRMLRDGANIQVNEKLLTYNRKPRPHPPSADADADGKEGKPCNQIQDENNFKDSEKKRMRGYYVILENKGQLSTYDKIKTEREKLGTRLSKKIEQQREREELNEIYQWTKNYPPTTNARRKAKGEPKKLNTG